MGGVRWECERRGGVSRHAILGSGCGEGPTKTTGLLKPPLDESRGAAERTECGPGFRGSGVRPVVNEITPPDLSAFPAAEAAHQPHQRREQTWTGEACHTS